MSTVELPRDTPTGRMIRIGYTVTHSEVRIDIDTIKAYALAPRWLLTVEGFWRRLVGPLLTHLLDSDVAQSGNRAIWRWWGPKLHVSTGGTVDRSTCSVCGAGGHHAGICGATYIGRG